MRNVKSRTLLLSALAGLIGFGVYAAEPAGRALFEKKCGTCHGNDGRGKTKMGEKLKVKDFSDPALWKDQTDELLTKSVVDGIAEKKMPAFKDKLSADELQSLVGVMRSFQPK